MPDVDTSPGLAGMYQVSPRHHYVCIFTNVKILHNMSGTDRDTPSVHPVPSASPRVTGNINPSNHHDWARLRAQTVSSERSMFSLKPLWVSIPRPRTSGKMLVTMRHWAQWETFWQYWLRYQRFLLWSREMNIRAITNLNPGQTLPEQISVSQIL